VRRECVERERRQKEGESRETETGRRAERRTDVERDGATGRQTHRVHRQADRQTGRHTGARAHRARQAEAVGLPPHLEG
jgi:hypothetical protein